jgi:phenylacetate-CoA ligase
MLQTFYERSPVPIQTMLLNLKALDLYIERYGRKFDRLFEEFDRNQWLSPGQLEEYQNEKLRALIRHAENTVPYYRDLMKKEKITSDDFKSVADLHKFPILKKQDIIKNKESLLSTGYPRLLLRHGHTSGTTGSPVDFYYDIRTCVIHHVADWRFKGWVGMKPGDPYASLQGRMIVPARQKRPPFWRYNYVNHQLFLSSFHLHEANIPFYFEELAKRKISAIEGYPSTLYILALFLSKTRQTFPLKAVFTSSETLFDYQRQLIENVFCCRICDSYGMAERVTFATECPTQSGHHLNSDYGITEFLDDNNEPVTAGRLGKIVGTGLHNFAMPLIRYEMTDASSLQSKICSCGRGFSLMDAVATKNESIVTLPDGRLISPSVLTHPFKPMHNIAESQIIQENVDELIVKIVKRNSYTEADEAKLIAAFKERLGDQVKIRTVYVDSIPRTSNGKFRWVISAVPPKF